MTDENVRKSPSPSLNRTGRSTRYIGKVSDIAIRNRARPYRAGNLGKLTREPQQIRLTTQNQRAHLNGTM